MSIYFQNYIEFVYVPGKGPGLREHARHTVPINSTSVASIERYNDVRDRCHIFAAATFDDCFKPVILACDVYLPDDYASFPHIERCLHGMTTACLQRRGGIPFEPISRRSKPRRYRIVPEKIDFNLFHSLMQ